MISNEMVSRLYAYMGGIIHHYKGILLQIGGTADHIHLLIKYNSTDKIPNMVRDLKAKSTVWVHESFPNSQYFSWQEGYAIFTVSYSGIEKVKAYIANQEKHHKKFSFEEEYHQLLKMHDIKYDERYVLG